MDRSDAKFDDAAGASSEHTLPVAAAVCVQIVPGATPEYALPVLRPYGVASVRHTLAPGGDRRSATELAAPAEAVRFAAPEDMQGAVVAHVSELSAPIELEVPEFEVPEFELSKLEAHEATSFTPEPEHEVVPEPEVKIESEVEAQPQHFLPPHPRLPDIALLQRNPTGGFGQQSASLTREQTAHSNAAQAKPVVNASLSAASVHFGADPLAEAGTRRPSRSAPAAGFGGKVLRIAAYAIAGWAALVVTLIIVFAFVNPPMSSLMLQQRAGGQDIVQDWVSLDKISPQIVRAVLLSEDGRFCQHNGVDFLEMQAAIERASEDGGVARGASTISMQVTKNLFLWSSKSYVRKAIEIPLTYAIELFWSKRRIMEVYLNIAEWGPGIFGVEAASRFHFDKAASRLNEREAAQLAVGLPNPFARDPGEPGPKTRRLASDVQERMRRASFSQTACVLGGYRGR